MTLPRLHLVTDDRVLSRPDLPRAAASVLERAGPRVALHVRGPRTGGREVHRLAACLRAPAREAGAHLFVNDRVDVALLVDADGVHLGARSLPVGVARDLLPPPACVGASVHDAREATAAGADGADYVFAGTVYETPSHEAGSERGVGVVREAVHALGATPVLGIGGVTPGRVAEVLAAGGYGVAVVRGVWDAPDPALAAEAYLRALHIEDGDGARDSEEDA